jgi:hypothetical protein
MLNTLGGSTASSSVKPRCGGPVAGGWIHGLRRTLGSWLAADGASLLLSGRTLNHTQVSTTVIYARLQVDPVRTALDSNAQRMMYTEAALLRIRTDIHATRARMGERRGAPRS